MIREYKTIREISGPLMVVDHVQGVTYDELAEIELTDGTTAAARCWRSMAIPLWCSSLKLLPASTWRSPRSGFWVIPCSWLFPAICWDASLTAWGQPIDDGPAILADEYRDINGLAMNPAARNYPNEFIPDRHLYH